MKINIVALADVVIIIVMQYGTLKTNRGEARAGRKFFNTFAVLALVLVAVWFTPVRGFTKSVLAQVGTPLWEAREATTTAVKRVVFSALSRSELVRRAEKLAATEDELIATKAELKTMHEENERLRNISADGEENVAVRIISRPDESIFDTIFIRAGAREGAKRGDLVFAHDSVVLGYVDEVYPTTARVVLYSRAGFAQSAFLSQAQTSVLLEGAGGQNFTVAIPQSISVTVGDTVSLPLADSNVAAIVSGISPNENEPIKTLYLRSPVNIYTIEWVKLAHI